MYPDTLSPQLLSLGVSQVTRPLVGVMARVHVKNRTFQGRQGPVLTKYLITARDEDVPACVFDPLGVDPRRGRMMGYVLQGGTDGEASAVVRRDLPLPKVVYDQILSRKFERSGGVAQSRAYLKQHCTIFNDGYFDKWEVHAWLAQEPLLRAHLPATEMVVNARRFRDFLRGRTVVFVKPIHGSLGLGIARVEHSPDGYKSSLQTKENGLQQAVDATVAALFARYRKRWLGTQHVVQEGLELIGLEDRPIDIRAIFQKDRHGEWRRTKLYSRMAARGAFVSNITTGGEAQPLSLLAQVRSDIKLDALRKSIVRVAALVPPAMERTSERLLGELGIDLGVDTRGHVYVIEVNSKPWKAPDTEHGSQKLVDLSFVRPILFARELARFAVARRESEA